MTEFARTSSTWPRTRPQLCQHHWHRVNDQEILPCGEKRAKVIMRCCLCRQAKTAHDGPNG